MCIQIIILQETQAEEDVREDNSQQKQSEQPEKESGERACIYIIVGLLQTVSKTEHTMYGLDTYCRDKTSQNSDWGGNIMYYYVLYIYRFPGCSPSVSQGEGQEEVKEELCSEKRPDVVCCQ